MNKASASLLALLLAIGLSAPGCAGGKAGTPPAPATETAKITMTPVVREVPVLKSVTHDASAEGISLAGEPHVLHVTAQGTPKLGGKTWLEGQSGAVVEAPLRYDTAQGAYAADLTLTSSRVPAGSYSVSAVLEKEGEEVTQIATASKIVRILPEEAMAPAGIPAELRKEIEAFSAYFETDDSTLQQASRTDAQGLGTKLQPFAAQIRRIRVVGHCDTRGSEIHNQDLGVQRAASLANILSKSLDGVAIVTESLGSANPDPSGQDPSSWAKNRWARIQVEIQD